MAPFSLATAAWTIAALLPSITSAAPTGPLNLARQSSSQRFDFSTEKVRGVNLGGWFVLEPWITPSRFEVTPSWVVDEWTMSEYYGPAEMESRQQQHWSTWITEKDFALIAAAGLNFVRIPIGYWSVNPLAGDPYVQGAYDYLAQALGWAADYGLSVMIDLHGAPGSQNGFDNSGRRGPIDWLQGDTFAQTIATLNMIRNDHASNPVVATIELVNEPLGSVLGFDAIENFYTSAYYNLTASGPAVTIQDAFFAPDSWDSWASGKNDIVIDDHYYQVFTSAELMNTTQEHISTACQYGSQLYSDIPTIVGEFTGAMTDCALWLNGRGYGSRYDGTYPGSTYIGSCDGMTNGTAAHLSQQAKTDIGQFVQAQMATFEQAEGWIFWAWKTETAPEWNYKELFHAGVIPNANDIDASACSSS